MIAPPQTDRIAAAGADVARIAETTVLVKLDDRPGFPLRRHPCWMVIRGLSALRFKAVHARGAVVYYDELDSLLTNPESTQQPGVWFSEASSLLAPEADIMIDLTNDDGSKSICSQLCAMRGAALISVSYGRGLVQLHSRGPTPKQCSRPPVCTAAPGTPSASIGLIAGGLALQEAVLIASQSSFFVPTETAVFDATSPDRTTPALTRPWPPPFIEGEVIEVVGCGGIGSYFLEAFLPLLRACEVRAYDPDHVGPENMAVQAVYSEDDIGKPKASVLTEKLRAICHTSVDLEPFVTRYEERPRTLSKPTLRVVCPDSFTARRYANDCALADKVPLVEAASSPFSARQHTYVAGRTACLEHRIRDLRDRADTEKDTAACAQEPAPTLPGSNAIIAGVLATEAVRALRPDQAGPPSAGTVVYDARFEKRFGIVDPRPPCDHGSKSDS